MGNLANKFLEAVNIISDAKTKSAGFDRSVQVTIKKLYQEDSTKYEVEYEGALKTATGATGYKTNDVVWAVIPKNDLTQTLQIIGLASSIAVDKQVLRSEDDKFEKVTPNLATFEREWNLPYEDQDKEIQFIKTIWSATGSDNDNLITLQASKVIDAIKSSLYFEIGAIFESSINLNADTDFGIRCYCNGVTDTPKFILDINDISGNPYYLIGERQKKIFSITTDETLESFDKIEFFAEGLSANDQVILKGFSFYGCRDVDYMTGLAANLLVSETGTDFRELGGLSTNNYNLTDADNLILKANLRYDGVLVTENELSKYTYKWYLKTLKYGLPIEIVIGDNPNTKDIVETWYFNKEESDDRIIPSDWFSTIEGAPNQLKVSAAALFMPSSWIWCEVVDEKGNKVKTVEGWIDNADKSYDLQLIAPTPKPDEKTGKFSSELTIKQTTKAQNNKDFINPPTGLVYKWFKDGVEMVDEEQEDKPPIRTSSITIFAENHEYRCEVYTTNNFLVFIETHKSVFIPDVPTMEQNSVIITGQTVYLCKANGEFIGQMSPLKAWFYKEGALVAGEDLTKYFFKWDLPDDDDKTMLKVATPINQQEITFNTKQYLLNEYTNNTVSVSVSDSSGETIASTSVEIAFLKNSQPGTNGTDIVCIFEKTVNSQTQSIDYYQIKEGSAIPANTLSVKVFRPSTGGSPDIGSISIVNILNPAEELNLAENIEISKPTCLKATCVSEDEKSTWYAYLPIVICSSDPSSTASFKLVEPSAAPYVQFSSGGNVAEDMPKTFTYTQGNDAVTATIDSKYLNVIKKDNAYNAIILQVKEDNAVFRGDEILPIVNLTHPTKGTIQIPILLLTNRFEYAAINGWDGTSIKLDEENNTVLAPMAGFGKKEEDNSFTGVVLGNITSDSNEDTFQGLIGMYQSERTFSLNANDGSAWFKGHIEATSGNIGAVAIDAVMPTNISGSYSWKFSPTDGLFMWKGAQGTISSDDPTGGALFSITENGLHMKGSGTFEGEINVTQGGTIGAFTIGGDKNNGTAFIKTAEFSGTTSGLYFGTSGLRIGGNFSVDSSGGIAAKSGTIGAFKIDEHGSLLLSNSVAEHQQGNYFLQIENTNTKRKVFISSQQVIFTRTASDGSTSSCSLTSWGDNKPGLSLNAGNVFCEMKIQPYQKNVANGGLYINVANGQNAGIGKYKVPVFINSWNAEVMTVGSSGHITKGSLDAINGGVSWAGRVQCRDTNGNNTHWCAVSITNGIITNWTAL